LQPFEFYSKFENGRGGREMTHNSGRLSYVTWSPSKWSTPEENESEFECFIQSSNFRTSFNIPTMYDVGKEDCVRPSEHIGIGEPNHAIETRSTTAGVIRETARCPDWDLSKSTSCLVHELASPRVGNPPIHEFTCIMTWLTIQYYLLLTYLLSSQLGSKALNADIGPKVVQLVFEHINRWSTNKLLREPVPLTNRSLTEE